MPTTWVMACAFGPSTQVLKMHSHVKAASTIGQIASQVTLKKLAALFFAVVRMLTLDWLYLISAWLEWTD